MTSASVTACKWMASGGTSCRSPCSYVYDAAMASVSPFGAKASDAIEVGKRRSELMRFFLAPCHHARCAQLAMGRAACARG